ncbi:methionyl-tRNA formyltransferase [Candidatus Peregrinibacteria bacterium]|nr:methionyl-tRNA formyltransferase [Candidatus Peregrinibacteria bacterium]
MQKIKVIFIGTGEFGSPILEALSANNKIEIQFVVTSEDKPAKRNLNLMPSPIKQTALMNKLFIQQPHSISGLKQKIAQIKPDILLVVSYGEIIPKDLLEIPTRGSINIHGSLLPKYRGASPIQAGLLNGDKVTGVTWIKMTGKMDAGPIIDKKELDIDNGDNYDSLSHKLSKLAALHTGNVIETFVKTGKSIEQNPKEATYCRRIEKTDGMLDPYNETAEQMIRKIKAYSTWPKCSILWNNKRIIITSATVGEQKNSSGEVAVFENKILAIGTQKGAVMPTKVQPESKREMSIEEFLRGQKNIPQKISS